MDDNFIDKVVERDGGKRRSFSRRIFLDDLGQEQEDGRGDSDIPTSQTASRPSLLPTTNNAGTIKDIASSLQDLEGVLIIRSMSSKDCRQDTNLCQV